MPAAGCWGYHGSYHRTMVVVKRSISIQPEVWDAVQRAVGPNPGRVSAFVNQALAHHARIALGLRAATEWEAAHGALTAEQLGEADRRLDAAGVGTAALGS